METAPPAPARDLSQSYQVTYGNDQQPMITPPTASFVDRNIVAPQSYQSNTALKQR